MRHDAFDEVAIIGMAGRFPGAKSVEEFWCNLRSGKESVSFFSDQELESLGIDRSLLDDANYVKAKGVLDGADLFDAAFFGYYPREAELMDPQQRVFLECAWEALENAGYDPARYKGAIGVYAGESFSSYLVANLLRNANVMDSGSIYQMLLGNDKDFLTTRVAYRLNLRGPAITIQTACSTSLVAVHSACQSLLDGGCDIALAGGVSVTLPLKGGQFYREGGIISPDGHCRAFDSQAQGCVAGNGVGIVVLKRLPDAIADRDHIYAVIKGSAVNNDGSMRIGYTAPSIDGQAAVITEALGMAGVEPSTIGYVEAHGTATPLGDPIEFAALNQVYRQTTDRIAFCALSSVKTNIGHLDAAAGVAGLIKATLALKNRELPPNLHFVQPNPQIDLAKSPFYVSPRVSPWSSSEAPRRAAVSSFGIGGTNAHLIIEEAPEARPSPTLLPRHLFLISAKTSSALETATSNLAVYVARNRELNLADAAYTSQVGRSAFAHRRAAICRDREELLQGLESGDPNRVFTSREEAKDRPVFFMFPGQGTQHVDVARELYEVEPAFRHEVDRCAEFLVHRFGYDIRSILYPSAAQREEAAEEISQTAVAQPILFVVEYALAKLWLKWGVHPQAMIGHSIGEYVAACLSGVFSLDDALDVVATRGRLMQQMPAGAMLAVPLDPPALAPLLSDSLSLAAVNGSANSVVSGSAEAIAELDHLLTERGLASHRLRTSHAFHSFMMEPVLAPFTDKLRQLTLNPPQIPFISNVSGAQISAREACDPTYWARHLRETVRFADGLAELLRTPDGILLEIGPGRTLLTLAKHHPTCTPERILLHSLPHPRGGGSDYDCLLSVLGRLWVSGVRPDWAAFSTGHERRRVPLPSYPFERQRYWVEPSENRPAAVVMENAARGVPDPKDWFYVPIWHQSPPPAARNFDEDDRKSSWLIFADKHGLGERVVQRLRHSGHDAVAVRAGSQCTGLSDGSYVIDPRSPKDYDWLLQTLSADGKNPQYIFYFWNVTTDDFTKPAPAVVDAWELHGKSLPALARAICNCARQQVRQLIVVSNNSQLVMGDERVCPAQAIAIGVSRVLPLECPALACRNVDIVLPLPEAAEAEVVIDLLLAEATAISTDAAVAYRGRRRWVQSFQRFPLAAETGTPARLQERGVYVVTDGLSELGLAISEYLARAVRARLVLLRTEEISARDGSPAQDGGRITTDMAAEKGWIDQCEAVIRRRVGIKAVESYPGLQDAANALCTSYICRYLASAGVTVQRGAAYATSELRQKLAILPKFSKLYGYMIRVLTEDGIARIQDEKIEFLKSLEEIEEPSSLTQKIYEIHPQFKGLLDLLSHCAKSYRQALAEEVEALKVLFPEGTHEYLKSTTADTVEYRTTRVYIDMLKELVPELVRRTPGEKVRILEIGAGSGVLTRQIAPSLKSLQAEYHFTDLGKTFVARAERQAAQHGFDFMRFGVLDVSKDPAGQGYQKHSFDIILGLNVVHATPQIRETIGYLKDLLAPNGVLFLIEEVKAYRWDSLTWGLAEGWWYFDDEFRTDSPFLGVCDWERVLCQLGFRHVAVYPQSGADRRDASTGLIVAQQQTAEEVLPALQRNRAPHLASDRDEMARRIRQLEAAGAEVFVLNGDVTGPGRMPLAVSRVRERFGKINGVIHSLSSHRALKDVAADAAALGEALKNDRLDFFFLLSNLASVTPAGGQAEDCAAGAFIDAFAFITAARDGTAISSVKWDNVGVRSAEAFSGLLSVTWPEVVVSPEDIPARIKQHSTPLPLEPVRQATEARGTQSRHLRPPLKTEYSAPRNDTERILAEIWQDLLGLAEVGVDDNFFELGGDSILCLQVVARGKVQGLELSPKDLFQQPTVRGVAALVRQRPASTPETGLVSGPVALTPIQHWFFEQECDLPQTFASVVLLTLDGAVTAPMLSKALVKLLAQHDALRLRFRSTSGGWQQWCATDAVALDAGRVLVERETPRSDTELETLVAWAQSALNLEHGPLIRAVWLHGEAQQQELLLVSHHLVIDGVSWRILLQDLEQLLQRLARSEAAVLPPKSSSYQQWATELTRLAERIDTGAELAYWQGQLSSVPTNLPVDIDQADHGAWLPSSLSAEDTSVFQQRTSVVLRMSIGELLLVALAETLFFWSGQDKVVVAVHEHGREWDINPSLDLTRTVGWFAQCYPVVLERGGATEDQLKRHKEQMRQARQHGLSYGLMRYLHPEETVRAAIRQSTQPQVSFNYLGTLDSAIRQGGLLRQADAPTFSATPDLNSRTHQLEARANIAGGRLQMSIRYSPNKYRLETIQVLMDAWLAALRRIIAFGQSERHAYTPSDFPLAGLDDEKLKRVLAMVKPL